MSKVSIDLGSLPGGFSLALAADFLIDKEEIEKGQAAVQSYLDSLKTGDERTLATEALDTLFNYDLGGFERALALLAEGSLPTDLLIEAQDVSLAGLLDAMVQLDSGQLAGKVLVAPRLGTKS